MPFPFTHSGALTIPVVDPAGLDRVMRSITTGLEQESARHLTVSDTRTSAETASAPEIRFRAGLFRLVSSHNELVAITTGRLTFSYDEALRVVRIRYRLTLTQMFLVATLMVSGLAASYALPPHQLILGWLWLFGANYLILWYRFPRFLRTSVWADIPPAAHPAPKRIPNP